MTLRTIDGDAFDGRFVQERISDAAVVILFALDEAGEPLVVRLDGIAAVVER